MGIERYKKGDLVEVLCERTHTSDQLATAFTCQDGGIKLYSRIELYDYPGFNDFVKPFVEVLPGGVATVVRYVGRPMRITKASQWWEYDVYEVIADGKNVMMFSHNMRLIT